MKDITRYIHESQDHGTRSELDKVINKFIDGPEGIHDITPKDRSEALKKDVDAVFKEYKDKGRLRLSERFGDTMLKAGGHKTLLGLMEQITDEVRDGALTHTDMDREMHGDQDGRMTYPMKWLYYIYGHINGKSKFGVIHDVMPGLLNGFRRTGGNLDRLGEELGRMRTTSDINWTEISSMPLENTVKAFLEFLHGLYEKDDSVIMELVKTGFMDDGGIKKKFIEYII